VVPILAIIFLALALFMAMLTRGLRDSYYIKHEMGIICVFWIVIVIVSIIYQLGAGSSIQRKISSSFWILLGEYNTFIWANFFPLFLAYRNKKLREESIVSEFKEFAQQLEDLIFRNALLDFLETQFCQENILFYQAVVEWKRMGENNPDRVKIARFIHENVRSFYCFHLFFYI